jgi:hypothetical protein
MGASFVSVGNVDICLRWQLHLTTAAFCVRPAAQRVLRGRCSNQLLFVAGDTIGALQGI